MRQSHAAGDKLFVDYAGDGVPVVDRLTGEIRNAQIFRREPTVRNDLSIRSSPSSARVEERHMSPFTAIEAVIAVLALGFILGVTIHDVTRTPARERRPRRPW